MPVSTDRIFRTLAIALAAASATTLISGHLHAATATATVTVTANANSVTYKAHHWSAWGGTVGARWNRELARDIGLVLGAASGRHAALSWYEHETFELRQGGSLEFDVRNGNLKAFVGGSLQAAGGYVIDTPAGPIALTDFRLVPRAAAARRSSTWWAPMARPGSTSTG